MSVILCVFQLLKKSILKIIVLIFSKVISLVIRTEILRPKRCKIGAAMRGFLKENAA